MNLKFSVVIPCRNAGSYIESTLQSVSSQTLRPTEIIVVDDGSTDDSVQRVEGFATDIKLLHSQCRNGAGTRNIGIAAATNEWIAFLDADDVWYPDHLARAAELLDGSDDVGFLNWFDQFHDESPEIRIPRPNRLDIVEPTSGLSDQRFFENYGRTHWFNMHGCVVRRSRLIEVGMLDETQTRRHDIEMWLRVVKDHTWSYDPVPSSAYRMDTPGSISRNVADASYFAFIAIKKNVELFPETLGTEILQKRARSAIIDALTSGSKEEIRRAYDEAGPYLETSQGTFFRWMRLCPPVFRQLNKLKRGLRKK